MSETSHVDLAQALASSPYPGRGLLIGRSDYGLVALYWITGRSVASRQRQFTTRGTELHVGDISGVNEDPLRHYQAAGIFQRYFVVGNGQHISEIGAGLSGHSAPELLGLLEPEPDPPIFTPRIAGVVHLSREAATFGAASRSPDGSTNHNVLLADDFALGTGVLLTTYRGSAEQPSAWGVPTWVELAPTLEEQVSTTWDALNDRLRIALASCVVGSIWNIDRQI